MTNSAENRTLKAEATELCAALRGQLGRSGDSILVSGERWIQREVRSGPLVGTEHARVSWTGNQIADIIERILTGREA